MACNWITNSQGDIVGAKINGTEERSKLFDDLNEEFGMDKAMELFAVSESDSFKDIFGSAEQEPSKQSVIKYVVEENKTEEKLTKEQLVDLQDFSNFNAQKLQDAFYDKNGFFIVSESKLVKSGLYNEYEASSIARDTQLQNKIKDSLERLKNTPQEELNIEEIEESRSVIGEFNSFGKLVALNPFLAEKEMTEDQKQADTFIEVDSVIRQKNTTETEITLQQTAKQTENNKVVGLLNLSLETLQNNEGATREVLNEIEDDLIEDSIDVIGLKDQPIDESLIDYLSTLNTFIEEPSTENTKLFAEKSDEYFKRDLSPKKETVVGEDGKEYVKLNTELSEEEVYNQQGLIKVDDNTYFKTAKEDLATLYENVRTYKEKYPKDKTLEEYVQEQIANYSFKDAEVAEAVVLYKMYFSNLTKADVIGKLKATKLAKNVYELTSAQIEAKLVELGVDANVAKQVENNVQIAIQRNNGNPLNLAPNGKPSILYQSYKDLGYSDSKAEALTAQVYSDSFKSWFGDSKVVDANNQPLLLQHGTKGDFTEFKNRVFGYRGFYFTDKQRVAKTYGDKVLSVFISAKNLVTHDMKGGDYSDNDTFVDDEIENAEYDGNEIVFKNFIDPLDPSDSRRTPMSDVFVVFNPDQIKSATENTGEFSNESNDIRFQIIGEKGASRVEAYKNLLDQAKKLEKQGKDYSQTGWFKNKQNQWKYLSNEILNEFLDIPQLKKQTVDLKELLKKDSLLLSTYPELINTKVEFYEGTTGDDFRAIAEVNGTITQRGQETTLHVRTDSKTKPNVRRIIAHELNHKLQTIENFPRGGRPASFLKVANQITGISLIDNFQDYKNKMLSYDTSLLSTEDKVIVDVIKTYLKNERNSVDFFHDKYELLQGEVDSRAVELVLELKANLGKNVSLSYKNVILLLAREEKNPNIINDAIDLFYEDTPLSKAIPQLTLTTNGFVYNGDVYLNTDSVDLITPIHEFNHLYNKWLKQNRPEVYKKGLDLVKEEIKKGKQKEKLSKKDTKELKKLLDFKTDSVTIYDENATAEILIEQLSDGEVSLHISEIWSDIKGQGSATKLLNKIQSFSDEYNVAISLRASTNNNIRTSGGLEQEALVKWYEKNSFYISEEDNNFEKDETAPFMVYQPTIAVKSEIQDIIDFVKTNQPNLSGEKLKEEVLTELVGRRGLELINSNKKSDLVSWLKSAWESIKGMLGLSNYSNNQIAKMNLKEFSTASAVDLLRGNPIVNQTSNFTGNYQYLTEEFPSDFYSNFLAEKKKNSKIFRDFYSNFEINEKGINIVNTDPISMRNIRIYADENLRQYSILSKQMPNISDDLSNDESISERDNVVNNPQTLEKFQGKIHKLNNNEVIVKNNTEQFIKIGDNIYEAIEVLGNLTHFAKVENEVTQYHKVGIEQPTSSLKLADYNYLNDSVNAEDFKDVRKGENPEELDC